MNQQKALLAAKQRCIQSANTIDAFRLCKQEQRQGISTAVTQGSSAMLIDALKSAGEGTWFRDSDHRLLFAKLRANYTHQLFVL